MPKKDIHYYEALPYRVNLCFDQEEQVWIVRYPELPGCVAHGITKEDAIGAGEEVKSLWLEVALEKGETIPEPQAEPDFSGKLVLRLPKTLHARAVEAANHEGVSLNTYLVQLISEGTTLSGVTYFGRFARAALEKIIRRIDPTSQAKSLRVLLALGVEPVYGEDKEPLPASELESLVSESPDTRESYAK